MRSPAVSRHLETPGPRLQYVVRDLHAELRCTRAQLDWATLRLGDRPPPTALCRSPAAPDLPAPRSPPWVPPRRPPCERPRPGRQRSQTLWLCMSHRAFLPSLPSCTDDHPELSPQKVQNHRTLSPKYGFVWNRRVLTTPLVPTLEKARRRLWGAGVSPPGQAHRPGPLGL